MSPSITINNYKDLLKSADALYKSRDYLAALSAYTYAIETEPICAAAYCGRGITYYRLNEIENARIDYNYAIELDPQLSIAYYRRGALFHVQKDYGQAIADYGKSIDLTPNNAIAYAQRGDAYKELYGAAEALIDWRFAAKLFKEQGNQAQYDRIMKQIDVYNDNDSYASGILW